MAALSSGFVLSPDGHPTTPLKAFVLLAVMVVVDLAWLLAGSALAHVDAPTPKWSRAINIAFALALLASVAVSSCSMEPASAPDVRFAATPEPDMNVHQKPEKAAETAKKRNAAAAPGSPAGQRTARCGRAPTTLPKYPGVGKLKDKVAVITGGDSGIGRAVAVAMAREGALISILYLEEHDDAEETHAARRGRRAAKRSCSPAMSATRCSAGKSVERTFEEFGRIDILVNNAAEQHETEDPAELDSSSSSALSAPTCSASST